MSKRDDETPQLPARIEDFTTKQLPPEVPESFERLTEQQKTFVLVYYANGGRPVDALKKAGYTNTRNGGAERLARDIKDPTTKVGRAAADLQAAYYDRWAERIHRTMDKLYAIAMTDISMILDVESLNVNTIRVKSIENIPRDCWVAIKKIKKVYSPDGDSSFEIELHDPVGAIRQLHDAMGMKRRVDLTLNGDSTSEDQGSEVFRIGDQVIEY